MKNPPFGFKNWLHFYKSILVNYGNDLQDDFYISIKTKEDYPTFGTSNNEQFEDTLSQVFVKEEGFFLYEVKLNVLSELFSKLPQKEPSLILAFIKVFETFGKEEEIYYEKETLNNFKIFLGNIYNFVC